MRKNVTISIDDKVKDEAVNKAKKERLRGGLSGYIEQLIIKDISKTKLKYRFVNDCSVSESKDINPLDYDESGTLVITDNKTK